jgi:hypothetical protein
MKSRGSANQPIGYNRSWTPAGATDAGEETVPAPRGNKYAKGSKTNGSPSLYKPQYAKVAKKLCERGATNADLALFFKVAVSTIKTWRLQYEDFSAAVRVGKRVADERVEEALYQRCVGYDFDFDLGRGKSVIRHVVPDVSAIRLWLFNRRPDRWRNKVEVPQTGTLSDRTPLEIKRLMVKRMIEWGLVPREPSRPPALAQWHR